MEFELIISALIALGLAVAWKYARRKLSESEMAAWEQRSRNPYTSWVRFVIAAFFVFLILASIYVLGETLAYRKLSIDTCLVAMRSIPGRVVFDMGIFSVAIGSLTFSFWFWNGVALYRQRLLDAVQQKS